MAIYKIFPFKDSTLYSAYPDANFGLDAISEVNNNLGITGNPEIARYLTQFDSSEITNVIDSIISGSDWDVNFRTFIANAQGVSIDQILEVYPIAQEWNNGTGEFGDSPSSVNGVTWVDRTSKDVNPWDMSGNVGTELFTGSFVSTYVTQGGGSWFYSGSGVPSYKVTQSLSLRSKKDLNIGTKLIVSKWYSGSIPNYGFITKLSSNS